MAQFYNLDEAARVLGMSPDELKSKAQSREIRAFLDSGSWRFRVADVDELARRRGMGSDPDLSLSDLDLAAEGASGSVELDLSDFQLGVSTPSEPAERVEGREPASPLVSDDDILLDDVSVPGAPISSSSSTILGMEPSGKHPSDSDVRLVPEAIKGSSDSDVRLAPSTGPLGKRGPSDSDVTLVSDEGSSIPGITQMFTTAEPKSSGPIGGSLGSSDEIASRDTGEGSSDFELTPSSVIDALQPESGSDFELSALDVSSDDFGSAALKPSDSDVTAAEPAASGINLGRPSDSGINLQAVGGRGMSESESIELSPIRDSDDAVPAPPKPAKPSPKKDKADLSSTALPIKGKDLFEDTDFEVDALDSGQLEDRTVQLDAASDFELEDENDSGSQVFAMDEEDVDLNAATAMAPAVLDEPDDGMGEPSRDEASGDVAAWDDDSSATTATPSRAGAAVMASTPSLAALAPAPEWSGLWVGVLGFASFLTLLLSFVAMDLVRNHYEWRQNAPASGLVRFIAETFGG